MEVMYMVQVSFCTSSPDFCAISLFDTHFNEQSEADFYFLAAL